MLRGSQPEISSPEETQGTSETVLLRCTQETEGLGREVIRLSAQLGECAHQAPGRLSHSGLGRAQNTGPTESAPLWGTREPEPEWCRPGKCTQPRACFGQFPCRATWSLGSVDRESTHAMSGGKPSVAQTLRAWLRHCEFSPHTPVRFVCRAPPSPQHNSTSEPK